MGKGNDRNSYYLRGGGLGNGNGWLYFFSSFFLFFFSVKYHGMGQIRGGKLLLFVSFLCVWGFTIMNHQGVKIYMSFVAIVQSIV